MKITWDHARRDWMKFEKGIEALRDELRCSYRGAWFRGHEDTSWHLTPSAFRSFSPLGMSDLLRDFSGNYPAETDLRRNSDLGVDDPAAAISFSAVESDVRAQIVGTCRQIKKTLTKLRRLEDEIQELARAAASWAAASSAPGSRDLARARRDLRSTLERARSERASELASLRREVLTLRCLRYGEKDAFVLFRARTNMHLDGSSWETLAAMQHYGAPTRMLDWTDTLAVALYFATRAYREKMITLAGSIPNWFEEHARAPSLHEFRGLPSPEIWILNPFHLARITFGQNRIDDPTLRPSLDYFRCFHLDHTWPFPGPLPITLPWRTPRLVAQRGYFTVHGLDCRPLDEQMAKRTIRTGETRRNPVLGRITLSGLTALYAVRHVVQFVGLDAFALFRDEDNLGIALREFMKRD